VTTIDLEGRVALVTGAGRGIGLASTRQLLKAKARVVANVRTMDEEVRAALDSLSAEFPDDRLVVLEGSVTDAAFVEETAKEIFRRYRRLDVLVNNAGILRDAYVGMISEGDIEDILSTNLASVIRLTQTMSRLMRRQKAGSIINLASIIGRRGNPGQLVYGASKAGVIGATYSAAKELAPLGIRVNAVAPGFIETAMTARLPEEARDRLLSNVGLGRGGTADDVADVILFLASDLSRYVTGQVIGVDGGLVL
jgi:3-oxoacyl-[acyl-carrier protein] reductase